MRLCLLVALAACATPQRQGSIREVDVAPPVIVQPTPVVTAPPAPVLVEPTAAQRVAAEAIARAFTLLVEDSIAPGEHKPIREAALVALGFVGSGATLRPWTGVVETDAANLRDAVLGMAAHGKLPDDAVLRAAHAMTDAAGDPSTFALSPGAKQGLFNLVSGSPVVQPGIVLARSGERFAIGHVVTNSGAAAAGARRGDLVVALDGFPIRRGFVDLMPLFGAPSGTTIELAIERDGKPAKLAITLGGLTPPILDARVAEDGSRKLGIMRLWSCTQSADPARDAGKLVKAALADFDRKRVTAIVLDLRGNAGGYPFDVASLFVAADPLLVALGQDGAVQPVARTKLAAQHPAKRPIVVIVDEQTSTGAEMIALVLREHLGAKLVGRPTAGGLAFPSTESIGAGISITYPISRAGSPKTQEAFAGNRLVPDLDVAPDFAPGKDPQLEAALVEASR